MSDDTFTYCPICAAQLVERVEDAALREVKEETNLDVQLEGLIGIYSEQGDPHVLVVYQASIIECEANVLVAQSQEVSELAYFTWEELPALAFPVDSHILNDWRKTQNDLSGF
jgi:8-oxo-dGTP diphosphatase